MFDSLRPQPAPAAPPDQPTRDLSGPGWHLRVDLRPQVLVLTMFETDRDFGWGEAQPEALEPACPRSGGFVSASMLALTAKLFDDGLYAAMEIAAQPWKSRLLEALADVATPVAAAAALGSATIPVRDDVRALIKEFLGSSLESKPLGFYTWSEDLKRIFRQDRLLQRELHPHDAAALAAALEGLPEHRAQYGRYLDLVTGLTNSFAAGSRDLRQPDPNVVFPASRSHETDLIKQMYGDSPIPDGFSLADEMIRRLEAGTLTLEPSTDSGWYDWQTWALEPLVRFDQMPERAKVDPNYVYRAQLRELFKAILALTRETHVKQVECPLCGASMSGDFKPVVRVWVCPDLSVEPVPSYYHRRARGYEFVRDVVRRLGPADDARRMTPDGRSDLSLDDELAQMIEIFDGAAEVASAELGLTPPAESAAARAFRDWSKSQDAAEDIRMMVPVFHDQGRNLTKVWAILGWTTRRLEVTFKTRPDVAVLHGDVEVLFGRSTRSIAYPVFAEVYVSRLLDRDEFRAHCDKYRTREAILANL